MRAQQIERSLITSYRKKIYARFISAIKEYQLISEGDKIAVCISGGKDSMVLAKCFQELKKHGKDNFEVVYLVMNPGYNEINLQTILNNAQIMEVPIQVFESNIFAVANSLEDNTCYMCARMRRGYLYSKAKELGCNKIALGHHFDDVIETILMGVFYNGQIQSMMPKLKSTNFENMELIRPLYKVREKDIINWAKYNDLNFIQCACRFTEKNVGGDGSGQSIRLDMKNLIKEMEKTNPNVAYSIFKSSYNIKLDTVIGYKRKGESYNFLDWYDQ